MKTFRHGGKHGDLVFSLPTIKALGGGILYVPERTPDGCDSLYSNMKALLEAQPYIHEVREYPSGLGYGQKVPGIEIDYDLDDARKQPGKGVVHIIKRHLDQFGVKVNNWKAPWLTVDVDVSPYEYTVINYTGRHIVNNQTHSVSKVNWREVVGEIKGEKFFVGLASEYQAFRAVAGELPYIPTNDVLHLAEVIAGTKAVYCNQSLVLALAQGLGKKYWCDFKPEKTNCKLFTPNEHSL